MPEYDLLIAGAGPSGCVIAERAASELGFRTLVVDRRTHIGGNCHDEFHPSGVLVHRYGPHFFRTRSEELVRYLSRFTEWSPGNYLGKISYRGELYPFPINLVTLEKFFGKQLTPESGAALLESLREKTIDVPANSEELLLSKLGRELYEAFFVGYTLKQWDRHPRDLSPAVCGRIPIRLDRDERYVDHFFQKSPASGLTAMFRSMLAHPKIEVRTGVDFREIRKTVNPLRATVYTGPIDEYFDHKLGALSWRSLDFDFREFDREFAQVCAQINYPDPSVPYTRSVEIKHHTGQKHPRTVVSYEYPKNGGEPYYPVFDTANTALYSRYQKLAAEETRKSKVYFCGRLAQYRYLNMDEAMLNAFSVFETLKCG